MARFRLFGSSSLVYSALFITIFTGVSFTQDTAAYFDKEKFPDLKTGAIYTYTGTWDGELAYTESPSEQAPKLRYALKTGSPITVLGFKDKFAFIQFDGKKGYLRATLLEYIAHPQGNASQHNLTVTLKEFTSPWRWQYWLGLVISGLLGWLALTRFSRLEAYFHKREGMEYTKFSKPWFLYITLLCGGVLAMMYLMAPVVIVDFLGRHFTILPTTSSSVNNFLASVFLVIALCFAGAAAQSIMKYKMNTGLLRTAAQWLSMLVLLAFSVYLCSFVLWVIGVYFLFKVYKSGFEGLANQTAYKCPNCYHYGGQHTDNCMNKFAKRETLRTDKGM